MIHWANYTFKNSPPLFFTSPYFSICTFNKKFLFLLPPYFHWANYTLNKTFSLEGKEAKNKGENLSQKLGGPQPKTGEKLHPILIQNLGGQKPLPRTA